MWLPLCHLSCGQCGLRTNWRPPTAVAQNSYDAHTAAALTGATRDALVVSVRAAPSKAAADQRRDLSLPLAPTVLLGRDADVQTLLTWLADPTARRTGVTVVDKSVQEL